MILENDYHGDVDPDETIRVPQVLWNRWTSERPAPVQPLRARRTAPVWARRAGKVAVSGLIALLATGAILGPCESDECANNGVFVGNEMGNRQGRSFVQFTEDVWVPVPHVLADVMVG